MRSLVALIALVLVVALTGCEEDPIGAATVDEFAAQRDKMKAQLNKRSAPKKQQAAPVQAGEPDEDSGYGSVSDSYVYLPEGKRDPFRSFQFMNEEVETGGFGPLGDYELGQLNVVAVVWDTHKPRALVADPGGRSFVVHEGSQMGKNNGRVIHIGDDLVLVKETYVDFEGNQTTKDVEMRIRRSQGG